MTPQAFIAARHKLGLTQEELAALLDVSSRQVQRWEAGVVKIRGPIELAIEALLSRLG